LPASVCALVSDDSGEHYAATLAMMDIIIASALHNVRNESSLYQPLSRLTKFGDIQREHKISFGFFLVRS
jgi:hypothetical protein